jgi:hypothetical protein
MAGRKFEVEAVNPQQRQEVGLRQGLSRRGRRHLALTSVSSKHPRR